MSRLTLDRLTTVSRLSAIELSRENGIQASPRINVSASWHPTHEQLPHATCIARHKWQKTDDHAQKGHIHMAKHNLVVIISVQSSGMSMRYVHGIQGSKRYEMGKTMRMPAQGSMQRSKMGGGESSREGFAGV